MELLKILQEDKELVLYRKSLRKIAHTLPATLLLSQIIYWWGKSKGKPFYKYKEPPSKQRKDESDSNYQKRVCFYNEGDSWTEELGITVKEFDYGINLIAHRKGSLPSNISKLSTIPYVQYWTTMDHRTFYQIINPEGLNEVLKLNMLSDNLSDSEPSDLSDSEMTNCQVDYNTENTTETTAVESSPKINTPHGVIMDRKLFNKPSNSVKTKKPFEPSDRSINIIDHWNSKNGLRFHKTGTQLYKDISNRIDDLYNGKLKSDLFKEKTTFQRKDFIEAINQFHLSATHLDYEPLKSSYKEYLQKMSLFDFLYNPSAPTDKNKSLFFHFLNNPAQKVNGGHGAVRTRKSDLPAISILSEWYKNHAVNPNGNGVYHFGLAVQRLKEYAKLHAHEFHPSLDYWRQCYVGADELSFLAMVLTEAIEDEMIQADKDGRPIQLTSGWLCSDRTFEVRLPKYLSKKNFIKGEYRI
jgi:hypothetical protein